MQNVLMKNMLLKNFPIENCTEQYDEMLKRTNEFSTAYNINNRDEEITRVEDLLGLSEHDEYFSDSRFKSPLNGKSGYYTEQNSIFFLKNAIKLSTIRFITNKFIHIGDLREIFFSTYQF